VSLLGTAAAWLVEPDDEPLHGFPVALSPAVGDALAGPPPPTAGDAPPTPPPPIPGASALSRVAVLGPPAAVPPLAAAVALACRSRARVPSALVALWRAPGDESAVPGPGGPVLPGAATLAGRLSRRELPVTARGRLAWLLLPDHHDAALPMLRHAEAAAGDLPVVLAVARPRDASVDAVLAERELLVLVATPGSPLADVAAADTGVLRVPVRSCPPLPPGTARLAALAGLRGPRLAGLWPEPPLPAVRRLPGAAPKEGIW
jgi:hypothetical protein